MKARVQILVVPDMEGYRALPGGVLHQFKAVATPHIQPICFQRRFRSLHSNE